MVAPPSIPTERLADWRRTDDTTETLFSAAGVTVTARLLRYEDDRSLRFFLAARLELTPSPPPTRALRHLVATQASRGFVDRLEDRGFEAVDRVERRTLRVGESDARLFGYDARCRVDGVTLSVDGWLAVWAPDRDFRLAGGAYPTSVVDGEEGETEAADALSGYLDPSTFRADLLALIRGTGYSND